MRRNWNWLGWCAVLMAWAVLGLYNGVQRQLHMTRATATAVGRVTSSQRGWQSRDDGERPEVNYVFTSEDGVTHTGMDEAFVPVGETVTVRYDPTNPWLNFLGDISQRRSERFLTPLLLFLAGAYGATTELRSNRGSGPKDAGAAGASRASGLARFTIVLLSGVSMYLLLDADFQDISASEHQFTRWLASLTFAVVAVFAYRWRIWWALAPTVPFALLLNPLLPLLALADRLPRFCLLAIGALVVAVWWVHPPSEIDDDAEIASE